MFDVLGGDLQITKKSLMTLDEVLKAVDGKLLSNTQENDFYFVDVACDSRKVKKDFIFFPLIGTQDGHDYIPQAIENGASVIFVTDYFADFHNQQIKEYKKAGVAVISVGHTMYALQRLAASYVLKFPSLIRIGITGSSGNSIFLPSTGYRCGLSWYDSDKGYYWTGTMMPNSSIYPYVLNFDNENKGLNTTSVPGLAYPFTPYGCAIRPVQDK